MPDRQFEERGPERTVLENGLVVLVQERPGSGLAAILLLYRAGSLAEPDGKTGLAHLTEHMMFRGTPTYPAGQIDSLTSSLGGINNGMTTNDHAIYYFVLPSEHWRTPVAIEADRMANCHLERRQFETERRIVLEERGMLDDDPDAALDEAVNTLAFTRHPYGLPVAGIRSDIERLSLADLRAFYESFYTPGNAVLAVVGDVRADEVTAFAGEVFGPLPGVPIPEPPARPEPPQVAARHTEVAGSDQAARALVAYRTPEATHPDSPALEVLASLLSDGRSSRLHTSLVRGARIAAESSADRALTVEPSLFTLSALLRVGADPGRAEVAILEVLDGIREGGIAEEEIEKAKALLELDFLTSVETALGLAGSFAFWESLGGWALGPEFELRVSETTAPDVLRVLEAYFKPEAVNSAWRLARPS